LTPLAGIGAALAALDHAAQTEAVGFAAAVDDSSGEAIRLLFYRDEEAVAATELAPISAIRLAGELLAGSRLADDLAELRLKNSG
jgi:hypothetical protein